jgi:hypothetical protein
MAAVDETALASAFLRELGAPDTPAMRRAVIAWMRQESGRSIIGNNPFNLTLSAARNLGIPICGQRTSSKGLTFAVFCSPTDGAKAAARLLMSAGPNDWRKYSQVVASARSNNPLGFLDALARSAWSADRYGGPANNALVRVYNSLGSTVGQVTSAAVTWGVPDGKILTASDIDTIIAEMDKAGLFDAHIPGVGAIISEQTKATVRALLQQYIGKPWDDTTRKAIQDTLFGAADKAAQAADPLGVRPVVDMLSHFSEPIFWARTFALIGGAILIGFGTWRMAQAT